MVKEIRGMILRLYYLIKKAHIQVLTPKMRLLGDPFVTQEFKSHINVEDPKFMVRFIEEWVAYYQHLTEIKRFDQLGKPIESTKLAKLSEDQKEKLETLKKQLNSK